METIKKENNQYAIMDKNGMLIENTPEFNKSISGYITDIIQKSRSLLNSYDTTNSIDILFDNNLILIKDNCSNNLNMTLIVENAKK